MNPDTSTQLTLPTHPPNPPTHPVAWSPLFWTFGTSILGASKHQPVYSPPASSLSSSSSSSPPPPLLQAAQTSLKDLINHPLFQKVVSPPTLGCFFGALVGVTPPLRGLFFGASTFILPPTYSLLLPIIHPLTQPTTHLYTALRSSRSSLRCLTDYGQARTSSTHPPTHLLSPQPPTHPPTNSAYLPTVLLVLAGSLAQGLKELRDPSILSRTFAIMLSRFVFMPLTAFAFLQMGLCFSFIPSTDSLLAFILLLQACMPCAQNTVVILQLQERPEAAASMAKLVSLIYILSTLPMGVLLSIVLQYVKL